MGETKTKNDPPEFKIDAKLNEIKAEMSRGDYHILMAIIHENINEKGDFQLDAEALGPLPAGRDKSGMTLPVRPRYRSGGSRPSSRSSDNPENNLLRPLSTDAEPDAKRVEFKFKFRGFQVKILVRHLSAMSSFGNFFFFWL